MIEHKCISRGCGKITIYENTAQRPSNCIECGRAVVETYTGYHNPVRQAKQGLLARARALFDKKVDRELDEVFTGAYEENVNAVLRETAGAQQPRVSRILQEGPTYVQGVTGEARAAVDAYAASLAAGIPRDVLEKKGSDMERVLTALDAQCGKEIPVGAPTSAFDRQEGGSHYADFEIQPSEFILANGLGFVEGNVIKYVCRHRNKNGAQDLRKAIHYLEMLLETEYGEARHGND